MHLGILDVKGGSPLMSDKDKARHCILASELLTEAEKGRILEILAGLPDGMAVCHGDFHPGNIIYSGGTAFVIDWSGASCGDFLSDVAHTCVLLTWVPRLPHVSAPEHLIQRMLGNWIARLYLRAVSRIRPFDKELLAKWILVKSAERSFYGLPAEKEGRARYVRERLA
jgi:thiamine kinase-like enzyme